VEQEDDHLPELGGGFLQVRRWVSAALGSAHCTPAGPAIIL